MSESKLHLTGMLVQKVGCLLMLTVVFVCIAAFIFMAMAGG